MAIRASHYTFREFRFKRRNCCADINHPTNIVSLFPRYVVEFKDDRVVLTAIYACRLEEYLRKKLSISYTVFSLVLCPTKVVFDLVA